MKQLLLQSNTIKSIYKEPTGLPLPPVLVITRWGTWITSINFYAKISVKIESFVNSLEYYRTAMVKRMKYLFSDNVKIETLKAQLAFIAKNIEVLPDSIEKLQKNVNRRDIFHFK